jgi:hypothetical protein
MTKFKIRPIDDDHSVGDTVYLCASYETDGAPRELWISDASRGAISVKIGMGYERDTLANILGDADIHRELMTVSEAWADEYFTTCGYECAIERILRDYEPDWHEWDVGEYAYGVARDYYSECLRVGDYPDTDYLAEHIIELAFADSVLLVGDVGHCVRYWLDEMLPNILGEHLEAHGRAYTYYDPDSPEYAITYTDKWLEIGCQCHHIDTWCEFADDHIRAIGCKSDVELWHRHRLAIFAAMARYNSRFGGGGETVMTHTGEKTL